MEIELKHGKVFDKENNLCIEDGDLSNYLFLSKLMIILTGFSMIINGYNAFKIKDTLTYIFVVIFILNLIAAFYVFNRSAANNIDLKDIKCVSVKNYFNMKNVVVLKLKNGKNRIIRNFINLEDSKNLVEYIDSKINLNF